MIVMCDADCDGFLAGCDAEREDGHSHLSLRLPHPWQIYQRYPAHLLVKLMCYVGIFAVLRIRNPE
jgi:hypothetical protein